MAPEISPSCVRASWASVRNFPGTLDIFSSPPNQADIMKYVYMAVSLYRILYNLNDGSPDFAKKNIYVAQRCLPEGGIIECPAQFRSFQPKLYEYLLASSKLGLEGETVFCLLFHEVIK